MIKLMIADSHPIMIHGFKAELGSEQDIRIIGDVNNGNEAIKKAAELKPDVIIMDVEVIKNDGQNLLATIKTKVPGAKIILETISRDSTGLADSEQY